MRKGILFLAGMLVLAGALSASAGSLCAREDTMLYKIETAVARGEISADTGLMYRVFALNPTNRDRYMPAKYRAEFYSDEWVCGTPVMLELESRWPHMDPDVKAQMRSALGDIFHESPKDGGLTYRDLTAAFATNSAYGGYPVYNYNSVGGHFKFHWVIQGSNALQDLTDANGDGTPDMIERYAEDCEYAYEQLKAHKWYECPDANEQKYLPLKDYYPGLTPPYPPEEGYDVGGDDKWDCYHGAFTGSILGMTTRDPFDFPETIRTDGTPYFMFRNRYVSSGDDGDKLTVAHEFAHGTQYMLDAYESCPSATARWYFEASAMYGEQEVYPNTLAAINRGNGFLSNPLRSLESPGDGGYMSVVWNLFLDSWCTRYWNPPEWRSMPDKYIVRDVWRALSAGDLWYTDDPTLNRENREAETFLFEYYNTGRQYLTARAHKDAFEYWTTWNWFTNTRDDGKHYYRGGNYASVGLANQWEAGSYPIVNHEPPDTYWMNHWGHGFYRFNGPPVSWPAAVFTFKGDPDNPADSLDWGGRILATTDGTTWRNLSGTQGEATEMFTPLDEGILQIRNPGQYQTIVGIIDNCAYGSDRLPFAYSFTSTSDFTPPAVNPGIARPSGNPDDIQVIIGANEDVFATPEVEVYFTPAGGVERGELITMSGSGRSFFGNYFLNLPELGVPENGHGKIKYRAADLGGNMVSGEKPFSAGYVAGAGGTVGDGTAALRVPAGALKSSTLFSIWPGNTPVGDARVAVAAAAGNEAAGPETVGPTYEIGPTWARMAKAAEVVLSYEGLEVTAANKLSVFRWNGTTWEDLGGTIDRRNHRVMAVSDRLGRFVLGYGELKGRTPEGGKPMAFSLYQNYPNPSRDDTVIKYTLPSGSAVELAVYDITGRRVATVVSEARPAGANEVHYNLTTDGGEPLAAGVYMYRLTAGSDVATKKMVVTR